MAQQSRFVSVNLNKSYGQPTSSSSVHGRFRSGFAGGGGSGGMVVLSRARSSVSSSAKAAQKLAIPPPLNLPSLRKEHERFDPASAGSGAGHGSLGLGSHTGSSVLGWSKPAIPPASPSVPEKDGSIRGQAHLGRSAITGNELGGSPYMPPGARPGGQSLNVASAHGFLEKAVILKGEDFPSLRATFSSAPKQREALKQKQKQRQGIEEQSNGRELPDLRAPLHMRPQIRSSRLITDNVSDVDGGSIQPLGSPNNSQKQDGHLPALLPQVLLRHTSDWTDDERDTGLCIPERERDRGFSRSESVQIHDPYNDRLLQDTGTSSPWSKDFLKRSSSGRDLHNATNETHEFGSSRFSMNPRDKPNANASGANKDRHNVRPSNGNREINADGINAHSFYGGNFGDGFSKRSQDYRYQRTELGSLESSRIDNKVVSESFSGKNAAKNVHNHHNGYPSSWSKGTSFQNNTLLKGQPLTNNKSTSLSGSIPNFGREILSSSSGVKPFLEDAEFDSKDTFSGSMRDMNAKVLKKKVLERQIDLHDPIRESFEAEVEKVLRLQEEERQRVLEEQTRALELAQKEEEEKERLAKEEEKRRRLLEEEARELALREEQEKLEVARRAEEQRIAREQEKRRYQMEEERRKEAAQKKLLELEARIARRQAVNRGKDNRVPTFSNEQIPNVVKERDIPLGAEDGGWEDGERMVERITGSGFSDSSSVDRFLEVGSRSQFSRDSFPSVVDRRKYAYVDSIIPSLDEENTYRNQRQDGFGYKRKEFHGGTESIPGRPSSKEVMAESSQMPDEYHEQRKPRWNSNKRLDYFKRNNDVDAEFNDDLKFGDVRMVQGNSHGSSHTQYNELSSDYTVDDFSSFTRSCQLPRQPHVPPPPYVTPLHRNSFRDAKERASSLCFIDNDSHYSHASRYDHQVMPKGNDNLFQENFQRTPKAASFEGNAINLEQDSEKMSPRCGSQLSLSVSSPPSSPALLSHNEMDVSRDSPPLPASADGDHTILSDSEHIVFPLEGGSMDRTTTSSSVSPEVDDEWPVAANEETLEKECQEFRDIAEAHEGDNNNLHHVQDMEDLQSDTQTCNVEQVILGFNEGVEIKLPNINSFEISSRNSEKEFKLHAVPSGCLEELITNGKMSARKGTADSFSTNISEMEQALHNLSLDPAEASDCSASSFEASQDSRLLDQSMTPATSLSMASSATDPPSLSFPFIVSQVEAPVSLQFGLFSGPSLIPSRIQAIQIGSIQMPIHSYTHTSPSLPQVSSHSPLFQFGQLRYAPILSESTLPPAPHGTSIIQPPVPAPYSFNQNPAGCLPNQAAQNISQMTKPQDEKLSGSSDNQISLVQKIVEPSTGNLPAEQLKPFVETGKNASIASQNWTNTSSLDDKKVTNESVCHSETHVYDDTNEKRSYRFNGRRKESQPQQHGEFHPSRYIPRLKAPPGILAGGRRKRNAYSVRTSAPAPSFPNMDELQGDLSGFPRRSKRRIRRTEFRVRDNIKGKKTQSTESLNNMGLDENSVATGITIRNLGKKDESLTKSTRLTYQPNGSSSGASTSRAMSSDRNADKVASKEAILKSTGFGKSHTSKGSTNASDALEDDGDVPLLNGVVCVFKQTGIEVPSNEDDFIEVRSKRQMLNDRREQRAKENKSKARVQKAPAKEFTALQSSASKANSNKSVASSLGDTANSVCSNPLTAGVKGSTKFEASFTFTANFSSQALPPIGTPSVNIGSEKRLNKLKLIPAPAVSDSEAMPLLGPSENKNVNHGYSALPLSSWDDENLAIDLTQTQLDEAMKPSHFGSIVASSDVLEPPKLTSSVVTLENAFPSCAASVNSLIATKKIQFGAGILPNVSPSGSQTISKGLGPPDSGKSDLSKDQNLANSNHAMFLVKEKCSSQPSATLEDAEAEAEAEAAASAIAVAAITSDEIIGPVIGSSSDTKTYSSADGSALTARGVAEGLEITIQSSSEESLTVALPADLSIDTPLSVWSALQSPQASISMLSQFSGAPPSHFPSFEMNQIVDGCLFSYGSNDESAGSQRQSQNGSLGSSTLGAWPQYHSGVDSFYHPPAGYNGTFISPGGMPGVQCPPPMVVYNHFPSVGQFGQIGLGYMGTAYIPAGKQPEWSQNQVSSNARDNDGDPNNRNSVSGQGTPTTAPSTVHNLGPGSSLMVASPLTMFDMNPFQSTANVPLQAWSPVPPPLHSVPLSIPLQQQLPPPLPENRIPLQFGRTGDASMGNTNSDVPHISASAEVSENISITNSAVPIVSLELVSAKQPTLSTSNNELVRSLECTISMNEKKVAGTVARAMGAVVNHGGCISSSSSRPSGWITDGHSKTQPQSMPGSNHRLAAGYGDQQRGNVNRAGSGGEWHRRFLVKKQGTCADKNIAPKMKQIYVAKPSSSGTSNQGQVKT